MVGNYSNRDRQSNTTQRVQKIRMTNTLCACTVTPSRFNSLQEVFMQSPLSALCETLKLVKSSSSSYREQLQNSEAVTRAVLIDPILRALGWDVANPATVEVEKPISSGELKGCLDYFLNTDNAEKPIVIEAKKLGQPLEAAFAQMIRYGCTLRIDNLFLTDGLKWFHFTEISATSQNLPAFIDLGHIDLTKAAAFFVERLDSALYIPEPQNVKDALQEKIDHLTRQLLDRACKGFCVNGFVG